MRDLPACFDALGWGVSDKTWGFCEREVLEKRPHHDGDASCPSRSGMTESSSPDTCQTAVSSQRGRSTIGFQIIAGGFYAGFDEGRVPSLQPILVGIGIRLCWQRRRIPHRCLNCLPSTSVMQLTRRPRVVPACARPLRTGWLPDRTPENGRPRPPSSRTARRLLPQGAPP